MPTTLYNSKNKRDISRSISKIHLEPTKECNARCPQCIRTFFNTLESMPNLSTAEIDPDWLSDLFQNDPIFKHIRLGLINGNAGDIVMHSDPEGLIKAFTDNKFEYFQINTNGGALSTDFWEWCGSHENLLIEFAIDGLSDTHHLYRRNTRFETVIKNLKAFIKSGGRASVATNINGNNKHQWPEISKLCRQLGVHVKQRYNQRFFQDYERCYGKDFVEEYKLYSAEKIGVNDYNPTNALHTKKTPARLKWEKEYYSRQFPLKTKVTSTYVQQFPKIAGDSPVEITCKVAGNHWSNSTEDNQGFDAWTSIFLSAEGKLFPCCWTENDFMTQVMYNNGSSILDTFKSFQKDPYWNSLYHYSSREILSGDMFTEIQDTWNTPSCPKVCRRMCSKLNPRP